jgi:hypothetical protein
MAVSSICAIQHTANAVATPQDVGEAAQVGRMHARPSPQLWHPTAFQKKPGCHCAVAEGMNMGLSRGIVRVGDMQTLVAGWSHGGTKE